MINRLRALIFSLFSFMFTVAKDFLTFSFFFVFYIIGFFAGFDVPIWTLFTCSFIFLVGIFRKKDSSFFENTHTFALHYGYTCFLVGIAWIVIYEGDLPEDSISQFSSFDQLIFGLKSSPTSIIHFLLMICTHFAMFMHLISIIKERYHLRRID